MNKITKCNNNNCECGKESANIPVTDAMGREMFWIDAGRPE
jgi:hypothetical protein